MNAHHAAWLKAHPHRSAEWLAERLRDGFDVHHLDGNPANDAPDNLVLIEHTDHMRLHGMSYKLGRLAPRKGHRSKPNVRVRRKRRAYAVYEQSKAELIRLALTRYGL